MVEDGTRPDSMFSRSEVWPNLVFLNWAYYVLHLGNLGNGYLLSILKFFCPRKPQRLSVSKRRYPPIIYGALPPGYLALTDPSTRQVLNSLET